MAVHAECHVRSEVLDNQVGDVVAERRLVDNCFRKPSAKIGQTLRFQLSMHLFLREGRWLPYELFQGLGSFSRIVSADDRAHYSYTIKTPAFSGRLV